MVSLIGQTVDDWVYVLDELVLHDSNTEWASNEFRERTLPFFRNTMMPMRVSVYGDATGNSKRSQASRTDWQIVRDLFGRYKTDYKATFHVNSSNPAVKDRVNCVNARLRNQAGERQLLIHPRCKQLILDLERVRWKADPDGNLLAEIDKSDPDRTHASDALGYMIASEFAMRPSARIPGIAR